MIIKKITTIVLIALPSIFFTSSGAIADGLNATIAADGKLAVGADKVNNDGSGQGAGGSVFIKDVKPVKFTWTITNNETTEEKVIIQGSGGNKYWGVKYFNGTDNLEITADVTPAKGKLIGPIPANSSVSVQIQITPTTFLTTNSTENSPTPPGSTIGVALKAYLDKDPNKADVVLAVATLLTPPVKTTTAPEEPPSTIVARPGHQGWKWISPSGTGSSGAVPPDPAGGSNGANRVLAFPNSCAMRGTFAEPDITGINTTTLINKVDVESGQSYPSAVDKPTYYIGLTIDPMAFVNTTDEDHHVSASTWVKTDSGVQWEWKSPAIAQRAAVPEGWTIFCRTTLGRQGDVNGTWANWQQSYDSGARRAKRYPPGELHSITMSAGMDVNGEYFVTGSGFDAIDQVQIWNTDRFGPLPGALNMAIRRVVGDTQDSGPYLSGSKKGLKSWIWLNGTIINNLKCFDVKVSKTLVADSNSTTSYGNWVGTPISTLQPDSKNSDEEGSYVIDFKQYVGNVPFFKRQRDGGDYTSNIAEEDVRIKLGPSEAGDLKTRPSYIGK